MLFQLSQSEEADVLEIWNEAAEQTQISDASDRRRSETMSPSDIAKESIPKESKTMKWDGTQNPPSTFPSLTLLSLYKGGSNGLLLRYILATNDITIDTGILAKLLGPNCTQRAIQEQLRRLRKIGCEDAAAAAAAAGLRKRPGRAKLVYASREPKQRKTIKAESKEGSNEKVKDVAEESEKDDESVLPSPAKRPRRVVTQNALDVNGHGGETGILAGLW